MIQVQDLKRVYKQDKQLAIEIAQILGSTASLKEATAKKAPAKKKPAANNKKKEQPKNTPKATPKKAAPAPAKKQDPKNNKNNKKKTAGETTVAKETVNDRMFILLRSADISQRLTGIKKALEAATAPLISQAKQSENYNLVDEIEKIRDRIVLHLNSLKKAAKQE